ncbi:MAG: hypothetical protein QNJ42_05640 [Crocosphaera sp.]|nr:hypothetical protein [Crocosphaera sp.]
MNFEECSEVTNNKIIPFSDKKGKSKMYIDNPSKKYIQKITVDGCLNIPGKKCDYLLKIDNLSLDIYIELKGCKVDDAIKQLENTINYIYKDNSKVAVRKFCYIIHTRCPLKAQEMENYMRKFKKNYNATLKFKSSGYKEKLANLT